MNLLPYVDQFHQELAIAAEAGGEEARALAERLTAPLDAAVRLILLEALTAAADEITRDLAPGSVEVRLRGRDPSFVVTPPPTDQSLAATDRGEAATSGAALSGFEGAGLPLDADEGTAGTSRISLRLPEALKLRIEEAAAKERLSVNAWLVRVLASALAPDDRDRRGPPGGRRYTGWVR